VDAIVVTARKLTVELLIDRKVYSIASDAQSTFGTLSDVLHLARDGGTELEAVGHRGLKVMNLEHALQQAGLPIVEGGLPTFRSEMFGTSTRPRKQSGSASVNAIGLPSPTLHSAWRETPTKIARTLQRLAKLDAVLRSKWLRERSSVPAKERTRPVPREKTADRGAQRRS